MPTIDQWLDHFRSDNAEIRARAAQALLKRADETPLPVLLEILDLPVRHGLHHKAVRALQQCADPALVDRMIERLDSPDRIRRGAAVNILGSTGNRAATPHLLRMIDDQETIIRADAVAALERLGDPSAIPALERQLAKRHDDDINVVWRLECALRSLRAIREPTGRSGRTPKATSDTGPDT